MRYTLIFATLVALTAPLPALAQQPELAVRAAAAEVLPPAAPATAVEGAWMRASEAFEDRVDKTFISNSFVDETTAGSYRTDAIMAFSEDTCPAGWEQLTDDEDGQPLFYAFGLLVDGAGHPRSSYVLTPACVKQ